jgi:hypothetical protein
MHIPVFVSCPTSLNEAQTACRMLILDQLEDLGLEPRALGRSDYPDDLPLREVAIIARHCSGGVILGFGQTSAASAVSKAGTPDERKLRRVVMPSAWNHLEAGILFGLRLPLLVFREDGVGGGIFDPGVTDAFVHRMPQPSDDPGSADSLRSVFLKWQARVREHYYRL